MAEPEHPNAGPEDDEAQISSERSEESETVAPVEALSSTTISILVSAADLAGKRGNRFVTTDDLFAAMVESEGAVSRLLADLGMDGHMLMDQLAFVVGRGAAEKVSDAPATSPRFDRVVEGARLEAGRRKAGEVSSLHLLTALLREKAGVSSLLLDTPGLGLEPVGAALNRALREGVSDPS